MSKKIEFKNINDFEKISTILSDIESSVSELSDCSSEDFIMLNGYLKTQYNRIEKISDNVTSVFEMKAGKDTIELSQKVRTFANDFYTGVKNTNSRFDTNSEIIEQIISYMNLMYIPTRNFIQNVITLNFLTNSFKFNLIYVSELDNNIFDDDIRKFQKIISELKKQNAVFDEIVLQIKKSFEELSEKTGTLIENNLINIEKIQERVGLATKKLKQKLNEGKVKIPELKKIKERYSDSINNIIINLQYSDIIKQKIEHISDAHRDMIKKINIIKNQNDTEVSTNLMLKIKDIADLQIAQLIRTNNEYQNAIKIISKKFVEISLDINILANETVKMSGLNRTEIKGKHDFYEIEIKLKEIEIIIKKFVSENTDILDNIDSILMQLNIYNINYNKFELTSRDLNILLNTVLKKVKTNFRNVSNVNDITIQFKNVLKSLKRNRNDIQKYFGFCIKNKELLLKPDTKKISNGLKSFSNNINDILKITGTNNSKIYEIILETEKLEKIVSNELNSGIKNIKYYDFYERSAGEIIINLRELYNNIRVEHINKGQKIENLEDIKDKYTMKSERDIHGQVTMDDDYLDIDDDDDDDIEFF